MTTMEWQVSEEQIKDFEATENKMFYDQLSIDLVINKAIPIYTHKKPNPKDGKADCPTTTKDKEGFRMIMRKKLEIAKSDEERESIIDKYTKMWNE